MHVLLLFLDGVGLGVDDPSLNPLSAAHMPNLRGLLHGRALTSTAAPLDTSRATLVALDACLGVEGVPQSATGQAALLTGHNVAAEIGYHYGPKPNPAVAAYVRNGNLFHRVNQAGREAALLSAYPPPYFAAIASGRRIYSAIPLAAVSAGLSLMNAEDLAAGRALAVDFTGQGWRDRLGLADTPLLSLPEGGVRLASLARHYSFAFFEYWPSDYAGHSQDMPAACALLASLDDMLGGLLAAWDDRNGLIVVTSDHGNLENLGLRGHTLNAVPALIIGSPDLRQAFVEMLHGGSEGMPLSLTSVAPAVSRFLGL